MGHHKRSITLRWDWVRLAFVGQKSSCFFLSLCPARRDSWRTALGWRVTRSKPPQQVWSNRTRPPSHLVRQLAVQCSEVPRVNVDYDALEVAVVSQVRLTGLTTLGSSVLGSLVSRRKTSVSTSLSCRIAPDLRSRLTSSCTERRILGKVDWHFLSSYPIAGCPCSAVSDLAVC